MIGQKMAWRGWLRRFPDNPHHRLLLAVGGTSPAITKARAEQSLVAGRIDDAAYRHIIETVEGLEKYFRDSIVDERDYSQWENLGNGGWKAKKHLSSNN